MLQASSDIHSLLVHLLTVCKDKQHTQIAQRSTLEKHIHIPSVETLNSACVIDGLVRERSQIPFKKMRFLALFALCTRCALFETFQNDLRRDANEIDRVTGWVHACR